MYVELADEMYESGCFGTALYDDPNQIIRKPMLYAHDVFFGAFHISAVQIVSDTQELEFSEFEGVEHISI